jgi:hypothetical protein
MNARLSIAVLTACGSLFASAQNVTEDPKADPVLEAISEFNNRDKSKPNEVTVVLDPVGQPPAPVSDGGQQTTQPPQGKDSPAVEPVLVTGKPPEEAAVVAVPPGAPEKLAAEIPEAEPPKPQQGLAVRIEKLQTGQGLVDPKQIKLLAPFPAKPLSRPPAGWHLVSSENAPPFTRKVEIAPGSEVTLTIRPHLLVPDSDGTNVFTISEPGYDRSLGYGQTATIGAILSNSIRQLDDESKQLGNAVDSLQQLLISLPKPEPQPLPAEPMKPAPVRKK